MILRALGLALCAALLPASARALELPRGAEVQADETDADADLRLATGPFDGAAVPERVLPGSLRRQSWRIPGTATPTAELIDGLARQVQAAGLAPVYACAARECGGFDFRFALDILPEPQMHVDLADYRYAALAGKDGAGVVVIVSRSADATFVQVSTLTPRGVPAGVPAVVAAPAPPAAPADPAGFAAALEGGGALVLADVAFAVGAEALADPDAPSLRLIAGYLKANPARAVAIVGHTDASGPLEANIALSRARARAVRAALVALGADGARIQADGVGYLAPRATNLTEAGRAQNRRVEVMLTSTR